LCTTSGRHGALIGHDRCHGSTPKRRLDSHTQISPDHSGHTKSIDVPIPDTRQDVRSQSDLVIGARRELLALSLHWRGSPTTSCTSIAAVDPNRRSTNRGRLDAGGRRNAQRLGHVETAWVARRRSHEPDHEDHRDLDHRWSRHRRGRTIPVYRGRFTLAGWGWQGSFVLGLLLGMFAAVFGAGAGIAACVVYLVAQSKGWPSRRAAMAAASPSAVFSVAVLFVVLLGFVRSWGEPGDLVTTAVIAAVPTLLFAAITFVVVRRTYTPHITLTAPSNIAHPPASGIRQSRVGNLRRPPSEPAGSRTARPHA